jgi:hypothetical protein
MSKVIKARILDISYNRNNNLFDLLIKDVESKSEVRLGIKGTDWGVNRNVPDDIIDNFCEEMKGKEKNLTIERDKFKTFKEAEKNEDGSIKEEELKEIDDNISRYPIQEIMNIIYEEENNES